MDEGTGRKRGGREGRRARRSEVKGQAPAFITRAIPFYEILGEEGLDRIDTHAHKRWKQVLATVEPPPVDQGIDEALREFIAKKKSAMPDSWY